MHTRAGLVAEVTFVCENVVGYKLDSDLMFECIKCMEHGGLQFGYGHEIIGKDVRPSMGWILIMYTSW